MDGSKLAPNGSEDLAGNTKPSPKKRERENSCIKWFFTWNNYPVNWINLFESLGSNITKYCIQEETGDLGTKHLQGCIHLKTKQRWSEFHLPNTIHWETCKDWNYSVRYCSKEETKTGERITRGLPRPLKLIEPNYEWEQNILEIIKHEPDDRKIYWYWSNSGGVGKTQFAKYLAAKHGAIPLDGKKNDILFCAAENESEIYLYILSREQQNYVSYDSIEKIKDGFYMCAKYESKPIVRNPPHLFIFANFPPEIEKLSADRWNIIEL